MTGPLSHLCCRCERHEASESRHPGDRTLRTETLDRRQIFSFDESGTQRSRQPVEIAFHIDIDSTVRKRNRNNIPRVPLNDLLRALVAGEDKELLKEATRKQGRHANRACVLT